MSFFPRAGREVGVCPCTRPAPRFGSRPIGAAFWRPDLGKTFDTVTLEGWMWGIIAPLILVPALVLEVWKLVVARRRVAEAT